MSADVPLIQELPSHAYAGGSEQLHETGWCDVAVATHRDDHGLPEDGVLTGLIERIEQRDARALAALYDLAAARIYSFVHRFTRRHALTEEVVEDTFWQVWRQAPRFDFGAAAR